MAGDRTRPIEEIPMIDLYYWPTYEGRSVSIFLEETETPYRLVPLNIGRGDQFAPDYLKLNPNHRMPAIVDHAPRTAARRSACSSEARSCSTSRRRPASSGRRMCGPNTPSSNG